MDTIFALATARGKAGVSIVRISGPEAWAAAGMLAGSLPAPRVASLRTLSGSAGVLDQAVVITFESGRSFTGEAVAELHLHGSVATVNAVLGELRTMPGLRMAEPGEFTRRALENGNLDLTQVEGLADLIEAETEAQRKQALRVLSGTVGVKAERWRHALIRAAALLEATIDFADEDVPVDVAPEVLLLLGKLRADFEAEIAGFGAAERIRDGFEVAIVGEPNVGKSTLLNALAGREAAITSEHAGTTRDVIEVRMDIGGLAVTILDTAGLREAADPVEAVGVARAVDRAARADLRVFLCDGDLPLGVECLPHDIVVRAKVDLVPGERGVSGRTGEGVPELLDLVAERLGPAVAGAATITRERHRAAIVSAKGAVASAALEITTGGRAELAAENLHQAIRGLDNLVGCVDVENILEEIFARFCIGK